ncbi:TIGR02556 family CRISPR-associated protein [Desulfofundulus thermobenzoicus]|uniref:TIGR02556 family CRISPR-associated protein n=1 Tax=Desulfofundulus thermobenzoicus TaxID=29376 RepID=UPI00128F72B1|nr:TIGR02556 family CRISPR-associated protein [Desulfofundulus thermobenzoicus]
MLEAVSLVGRTLARGREDTEDTIGDLIKQPPAKPPRVERIYLVKLNFQISENGPRLDADMEEIDSSVLYRYRWVGNRKGSRPQMYLTTDKLDYLVGQALPNLRAAMEEMGRQDTRLYQGLLQITEHFFQKLPDGSPVLDPGKAGLAGEDFLAVAWEGTAGKPRERARDMIGQVADQVKKFALAGLGIKSSEAALWTVLFNGEPLATDPAYAAVVVRSREGAVAEGSQKSLQGICSVCGGMNRPVTYDLSQLDFLKCYITDKIGFASGVSDEGFKNTFLVCSACFRSLLLAEEYIRQHLGLRIGQQINFLVLPAFLIEPDMGREDLEAWAERLRARVGTLSSAAGWLEKIAGRGGLETELADFLEEQPQDNLALLNFLFYQKNQSEFRVLGLVKDVAPGRIAHLLQHSYRLAGKGEALFGVDHRSWWLDLTRIYRLIPISEGRRGAEHKKLLYIYEALLGEQPVNYHFLIRQFVALAAIFQTGGFAGTNIQQPQAGYEELEMGRRILQANLLLKLLREENLLEGEWPLPGVCELEGLNGAMQDYLREMDYNGPATALFLLGYLMNQVGREQAEAGYRQKPVLEKLNYAGMLWSKVVRLSNIVFDQLRQYDILRYNEGLFAIMKKLFDAHREQWPFSPEENVFYILSGYAYATRAAIKAKADRENNASNEGGTVQ